MRRVTESKKKKIPVCVINIKCDPMRGLNSKKRPLKLVIESDWLHSGKQFQKSIGIDSRKRIKQSIDTLGIIS